MKKRMNILIVMCLVVSTAAALEFGVAASEVSRVSNTGHAVQVWQILSDFVSSGEYTVSIKHAVAGEKGAFYMVAWADTNDDGIPDTEIGRSELKTASVAGQWSAWQFTTDHRRVYVGNTWSQSNEQVYYQNGGVLDGYVGLSNRVFYARSFNAAPRQSTQPRYTNIRVSTGQKARWLGVTEQPVTRISNTGHAVQVWEIEPQQQAEDYTIEIQHAVAGEKGAFYIIAWADTNDDGVPDTEIARSKKQIADAAGTWSRYQFHTNQKRVFIGNTWDQSAEQVYYQNGGTLTGYQGLSRKVYYSRSFNAAPRQSVSPRYTNIRYIAK